MSRLDRGRFVADVKQASREREPQRAVNEVLARATSDPSSVLEGLGEPRSAGLNILLPLPFYWVDFGGSNNVTTRLRRNPHRRLVRQFTDAPRLLQRERSYRISVAQNGRFAEFWVDGRPMMRVFDPHPLTAGHVGFRAFCAGLRVEDLKVWRIG